MDVICVDNHFSDYQLEKFREYGVIPPELNKLYSIREVIKHHNGEIGVLLNELKNPEVPFISFTGLQLMRETSFRLSRFRDLLNQPIVKEEIENLISL